MTETNFGLFFATSDFLKKLFKPEFADTVPRLRASRTRCETPGIVNNPWPFLAGGFLLQFKRLPPVDPGACVRASPGTVVLPMFNRKERRPAPIPAVRGELPASDRSERAQIFTASARTEDVR